MPVESVHLIIPWEPRVNMSKTEFNLDPKSISYLHELLYPGNHGRHLILFLSPSTSRRLSNPIYFTPLLRNTILVVTLKELSD